MFRALQIVPGGGVVGCGGVRVQTNFKNSAEYRISAEIRLPFQPNWTQFLKIWFRFNRNRNTGKKFGFNRILTEFLLPALQSVAVRRRTCKLNPWSVSQSISVLLYSNCPSYWPPVLYLESTGWYFYQISDFLLHSAQLTVYLASWEGWIEITNLGSHH